MDFDPNTGDPALSHSPIKAMVAPRPIGWLSTLSPQGVANLAPYSFFNLVCDAPYMVMFATSGHKDSFNNVRATGEFVWNLVSEDLCEAMNASSGSAAPGVDEFELAGLEKAASRCVAPPRVARARAALECQLDQIVDLKSDDPTAGIRWSSGRCAACLSRMGRSSTVASMQRASGHWRGWAIATTR